nr:glycosyltransferase [uncultured Acetatifactor sp.]
MPKVSVIMPLYNAERFVKKAIDSILQQTYKDFEFIIIDDCGQDSSIDIVSSISDSRIRILSNDRNRGIAFSRNRGLDVCRGEYIALMDDDDLASLDRFEKEVDYLETHMDIDVVGGNYCHIDENDKILHILPEPLRNPRYIKAALLFFDPIGNGTTMFRREFVMKNNIRFQDNCLGMEDYLFWVDCSLHGNITNINELMLYWRQVNNETKKMITYRKNERAECFKGIQRYAFEKNGFDLLDNEFEILLDAFTEHFAEESISANRLQQLYYILRKITKQAEREQFSNYEEIKILCRKLFATRLQFSDLWC